MVRSLLVLAAIFCCRGLFAQQFLSRFNGVSGIVNVGSKAFFAADDGVHGMEIWVSDGTRAGTVLVKDISSGVTGSDPRNLTSFNGELYFTASTLQYGRELWKSDGTPGGTVLVKDLRPGNNLGSEPYHLVVFQNKLYFGASPDGFNKSFYQSNGTSGGTVILKDLGFGEVSDIEAAGSYVYFVFGGGNLWRSDGSSPGTATITVDGHSYMGNLQAVGNTLFLTTSSAPEANFRLYAVSGTTPSLLKEYTTPASSTTALDHFTVVNGVLYFSVRKAFNQQQPQDELWKSNGTVGGTTMVKSFGWLPPSEGTAMKNFVAYKSNLYFQAGSSGSYAFWKSDGTDAGTTQVKDVEIGYPYQDPNAPAVSDGSLFFSGDGELWISDGSAPGTMALFDINQGQVSVPQYLTDVNGRLFFAANDGYGISLWTNSFAAEIDVQLESAGSMISGGVIAFGDVQVDGCGKLEVEIVNAGKKELIISEVSIAGQDFFVQGQLPAVLKPGERHPFNVYFVPLTEGQRTGSLMIRSNDSNEGTYRLQVSGNAIGGGSSFCDSYNTSSLKKQLQALSGTGIVLSNNSIKEKMAVGTVVGTLSVAGSSGFYNYSLVSGEGDTDNSKFLIQGNTLKAQVSFNYEFQNVHTIRVRASDDSGDIDSQVTIIITQSNGIVVTGACDPTIMRLSFGLNDIEFNGVGDLFAVGENGRILRSTNGGSTWTSINSGVRMLLNRIIFKGAAGYIIGDGVVLKSEDNGTTWSRLHIPYNIAPKTMSFVDDNTGYVLGYDGEVLQTKDGGKHWKFQGSHFFDPPSSVFFWTEAKGIACTEFGSILKTTDGGQSWYVVSTSQIGNFNTFESIAFKDANTGFLLSTTNLFESDDGGETWFEVTGISGQNFREVAAFGNNWVYLIGGYANNEIWLSTNGGTSWSQVGGDPITGVTGIAYKSSSGTVALSGNNSSDPGSIEPGSAILSAPAGSSAWVIKGELRTQDFNAVDFPSASTGYVFGEFEGYKTTDGGLSWHKLSVANAILTAQFADDQTGFIADGYHVFKTTNGGTGFSEVYNVDINGTANLSRLIAVSGSVVFAYSGFGTIYRTTNGGGSWSEVFNQPLNQLKDVDFPTSQVGYGIDLLGKIIKTTNGGTSWSTIYTYSGSGEFFNTIAFVDANTGFIGGKDGLMLKTTNGGTSWAPVFGGIPSTIQEVIFESSQVGYAFLEQGTIYRSADGGSSWTELGNMSFIGLKDVSKNQSRIYYAGQYGNLGKIDMPFGPTRPGYISGPEVVCMAENAIYEVAGNNDQNYFWSISGASLTPNGSSASVRFSTGGSYMLSVQQYNACGTSISRSLNINVDSPPAPVILGAGTVSANSNEQYVIENPDALSRYAWNVSGATSFTPDDDLVNVNWSTISGKVSVMETETNSGCRAVYEKNITVDPSTIVGISPDASIIEAGLNIYPNPTADKIYIESTLNSDVEVRVYDLMGREYQHGSVSHGSTGTVNFSVHPKGLYLLEVSTPGSKSKVVKRIVKE